MGLIDILEIGSLNTIYELGLVAEKEFSFLISEYPIILNEILDFPDKVIGNFR